MPRVRISRDERYPVYSIDDEHHRNAVVEVDGATLERWLRVSGEYEQMQREMYELLVVNPEYYDGQYWLI